jgi:hypothetical protein
MVRVMKQRFFGLFPTFLCLDLAVGSFQILELYLRTAVDKIHKIERNPEDEREKPFQDLQNKNSEI